MRERVNGEATAGLLCALIGRAKQMSIQAVRFARPQWTERGARAWMEMHGYAWIRIDVTPKQFRFRVRQPGAFRRMVAFVPHRKDGTKSKRGVSFVLGYAH